MEGVGAGDVSDGAGATCEIELAGDVREPVDGDEVTVGRADLAGVVGLDATDVGISRLAARLCALTGIIGVADLTLLGAASATADDPGVSPRP